VRYTSATISPALNLVTGSVAKINDRVVVADALFIVYSNSAENDVCEYTRISLS
jgi:hypothetical protein